MALIKEQSLRQAIVREKALLVDLTRKRTESQARLAVVGPEYLCRLVLLQVHRERGERQFV